jgi:hypothetical protein
MRLVDTKYLTDAALCIIIGKPLVPAAKVVVLVVNERIGQGQLILRQIRICPPTTVICSVSFWVNVPDLDDPDAMNTDVESQDRWIVHGFPFIIL